MIDMIHHHHRRPAAGGEALLLALQVYAPVRRAVAVLMPSFFST